MTDLLMKFHLHTTTVYHCTLERAFKTPLLCDIAKVHTGYGFMPRITHCIADAQWGKEGSTKKVNAARSLTQRGGFLAIDRILERKENERWRFEVTDFQSWMLGFSKFSAEWRTTEIAPHEIQVDYAYTLHCRNPWLFPMQWLFAHLFWEKYMRRVLEKVRRMAYDQEPYLYP